MPEKGKQYKCSACKDKHSPPAGKCCSKVHGDTIIEDLSFIQNPPTQAVRARTGASIWSIDFSINSQSNTRTSTPHRMRQSHSVAVQGCNEATRVAVPVSSSSVGVCFTSALPLSTMASAGCQYTSPL